MTDKRMLLPQPIVASLLSGATQVSVPVRPQPRLGPSGNWWWDAPSWLGAYPNEEWLREALTEHCPFPVGTRVWVPETWWQMSDDIVEYKADGLDSWYNECEIPGPQPERCRHSDSCIGCPTLRRYWRSPATMPSWAARLRYIIEGVEAKNVQKVEGFETVWVYVYAMRRL